MQNWQNTEVKVYKSSDLRLTKVKDVCTEERTIYITRVCDLQVVFNGNVNAIRVQRKR